METEKGLRPDECEKDNQGRNRSRKPCGKVFRPTPKGGLGKPFWQNGGVSQEIGGVNSEEDEILD